MQNAPTIMRRVLRVVSVTLFVFAPLAAQQRQADEAWNQGRFGTAREAYRRVLAADPAAVRANLRIGVMLSWEGRLDSALVFLERARAGDPADPEIRLIQARVLAWDKQYDSAILRYDSLLTLRPGLREALLGRAQTLAWAGRLAAADAAYQRMLAADSTDREAKLGSAQVSGWTGELERAEREYSALLRRNPRDVEARVGLGYVYLWQGREQAAERQAGYALRIDPSHKAARELRRDARESGRASTETSTNWSNDSDANTSFWQTLAASAPLRGGWKMFGSVNALETSDPVLQATRIGGEAGLTLTRGSVQLTGAAGARRLYPELTPERTAATYRARTAYRRNPKFGVSLGYSRLPFDEIASLIERNLDLESLEGGFDLRPAPSLTVSGGGGALWLSDGNSRTSISGGVRRKIERDFSLGLFGRRLSYQRRETGYFSPDRFSVLEVTAGYDRERKRWSGSLGGGLGVQQVGRGGATQTEWHVEGRIGHGWGIGNRVELFGLITNSAASSTTGAFRYRTAGLMVRIGL